MTVLASPMSYSGSAQRIWRLSDNLWYKVLAVCLISIAWCAVTVWYAVWLTLFLVPFLVFRVWRRGRRREKLATERHEELKTHGNE